ncbi:MAG TPA: hypothetical protein VEI97_02005, partial [bacterium]|nr:hypothetical protein [bacterium]
TPAGDVPTLTQFFLRNLLRPADLFLSALGVELFLLFWSPRSQRLGDLAAGTLVIRDQTVRLQDVEQALARHEFLTVSAGHAGDAWVRRVEPADIELLRRFLARQHSLARDQRRELASRIVQHFESKFGTALLHSGLTDDEKLTRYWEALSSRHAGP